MTHDHVEGVAVNHQEQAVVGSPMDCAINDFNFAEVNTQVVSQELVVISRNIDEPNSLADLSQELLNHVVVFLRPVPGRLQSPAVNDIPHKVDGVRVYLAEEVEKSFALTPPGSKV